MQNLNSFLNPFLADEVELPVSERFKDEKGKPILWKIKPIEAGIAQELLKRFQKMDKKGNLNFDNSSYQTALICASVIYPDLKDAQLQKGYGVLGEMELISKMLLIGEFSLLRNKVFEISGLYDDVNEKVEEAKN